MARGSDRLFAAVLVVERVRAKIALLQCGQDRAETQELLDQAEIRLAGKEGLHRRRMVELFGLNQAECDALDCAVAAAVEPSIGQALGELQGSPGLHLPGEVALRLVFGHGPAPVVHTGSPLVSWGLLEIVERVGHGPITWRADQAVVDWYFDRLTASTIPVSRIPKVTPLPEWKIPDQAKRIKAILDEKRPVRIAIIGSQGTGRASLAQALASELGKQAVAVQSSVLSGDGSHFVFQRLQRLALLGDLALIWRGRVPAWPAHLPLAMIQFVTLDHHETLDRRNGLVDLAITMPALGQPTKTALYQKYLPGLADKMADVLGQPRLGDLADASAQKIEDIEGLRVFMRQRNSARTGNIGRIEPAEFTWDDLILDHRTKQALRDFAAEARLRADLLADPERRRVMGSAAHLTALFSGSPGLGKSMSAKVIARDLGLELLVVDYASMASKYIGETAKHLTAAFQVSQDAHCALVIDEADTLFASRTKVETANDRYGNADIGHLLQLMEKHEGVVMLSTNKRSNIDPAFTRRLRYIVEFRRPEAAEREKLWARMLGLMGVAEKALADIVPPLAAAHELTPAQIKGAALSAAYRARSADREIAVEDIDEGVRIEFRKEGRLVTSVPTRNSAGRATHG